MNIMVLVTGMISSVNQTSQNLFRRSVSFFTQMLVTLFPPQQLCQLLLRDLDLHLPIGIRRSSQRTQQLLLLHVIQTGLMNFIKHLPRTHAPPPRWQRTPIITTPIRRRRLCGTTVSHSCIYYCKYLLPCWIDKNGIDERDLWHGLCVDIYKGDARDG